MKTKPIFMLINHIYQPVIVDNKKQFKVVEQVTLTDSPKLKQICSAVYIINIENLQVTKARYEQLSQDTILQYIEKYSKEIAQFYAVYRPEIIQEMIEKQGIEESKEIDNIKTTE